MNKFIIYTLIILAVWGCDDVNEKHEQYLEIGSPVFAGKIDSLKCFSGNYRIKVTVYPSIDVNRKELRVYWNNYQDSVVMPYNEEHLNTETGWYETEINTFEEQQQEGYITFFLRNFDTKNNGSKISEQTVLVYGNDYASALLNQGVAMFDGQYITLSNRSNIVGLKLRYTQNSGTIQEIEYKEPKTRLKLIGLEPDLPDYKSGTSVEIKSLYHLMPTDLDSIYSGHYTASAPITLPDPLILDQNFNKYGFEESFNIPVQVYEGETFRVQSNQDWCTASANNQTGNIEVTISNNSGNIRTASLTVSVVGKIGDSFTKEVIVSQSNSTKLDNTKSEWTKIGLPDDNGDAWGWRVENLWNNSLGGSGFHTGDNDRAPYLISVDFGKPLLIEALQVSPRQQHTRNPEKYEIWASNTKTEVGVDRDSDQWEAKAIESGWTKIATVDHGDWKDTNPRVGHIGATDKYRYMRMRILRNSASNSPLNLMEISVIGKE